MQVIQSIQNRIYGIRGEREMPARLCYSGGLDFNLAALYEAETKVFNQAAKRRKWENRERIGFKTTK